MYAGYVVFDVTVISNGNHPDPLSPRKTKEDAEGRFYVTPTSFSNTGEVREFSRMLDLTRTSYPVSMYSNVIHVTLDNPYTGSDDDFLGKACCLETYWGQLRVTNTFRVTGRYTP